jgi:hypothetical protein
LTGAIRRRLERSRGSETTGTGITPWALAALGAIGFAVLPNFIGPNVIDLQRTHRALVYQAHLRQDAATAVRRLGGASRVLSCGSVMTEGFQVPMLAWTLGVHTLQVEAAPLPGQALPPPPNVIFQTRAQRNATLLPRVRDWSSTVPYQRVAHVRTFRVYSHCTGKVTL